jgi:hypothetical protein
VVTPGKGVRPSCRAPYAVAELLARITIYLRSVPCNGYGERVEIVWRFITSRTGCITVVPTMHASAADRASAQINMARAATSVTFLRKRLMGKISKVVSAETLSPDRTHSSDPDRVHSHAAMRYSKPG